MLPFDMFRDAMLRRFYGWLRCRRRLPPDATLSRFTLSSAAADYASRFRLRFFAARCFRLLLCRRYAPCATEGHFDAADATRHAVLLARAMPLLPLRYYAM